MNSNNNMSWGRLGFLLTGLALSGLTAYLIAARKRNGSASTGRLPDYLVDDQKTGQTKAARILRNLRDRGFGSSSERLALALGRSTEEIESFVAGREVIDGDVIMKARGIAMNRGVRV